MLRMPVSIRDLCARKFEEGFSWAAFIAPQQLGRNVVGKMPTHIDDLPNGIRFSKLVDTGFKGFKADDWPNDEDNEDQRLFDYDSYDDNVYLPMFKNAVKFSNEYELNFVHARIATEALIFAKFTDGKIIEVPVKYEALGSMLQPHESGVRMEEDGADCIFLFNHDAVTRMEYYANAGPFQYHS